MAVRSKVGINGTVDLMTAKPKRSRQGQSKNTKLSATSRNGRQKRNRGQGKG